jgi:DNA-binding response OmpR family regulator
MNPLSGRRILIVEDEYLIASEMATALDDAGAEVIGPTAHLHEALELLDTGVPLDGAVLDIHLHGVTSFPLVDILVRRGVPVIFATGYGSESIPDRYRDIGRCEKPVDAAAILRALFG